MNKILLLIIFFSWIPTMKAADCCASQGGISGTYTDDGYAICMDETPSYDAACRKEGTEAPPSANGGENIITGCTNKNAKNYNANANRENGTCLYYIYGCTNKESFNYNVSAEKDDGSCISKVFGCPDLRAKNYKEGSNTDDGSCQFQTEIEEEKIIYYKTEYKDDDSLLAGEEKVVKKGKNGRSKIKYRVIIDAKGKELSRVKILEETLEHPQKEVVKQGSWDTFGELTLWLYTSNIICLTLLFLVLHFSKNKDYYIIRSIRDRNFTTRLLPTILPYVIKTTLYILYFLVSIPLYIDIICLIKNWIVRNFINTLD